MGVTFIGNPFDQDAEYDESDWDMNGVEEWIMPPQEVAFLDDATRAAIDLIPTPDTASSDTDEDYIPDEDEEDEDEFGNDTLDFEPYFYDLNEDEEDIDYVTYPLSDENDSEPEKSSTAETSNPDESSDTD